MASGEDPLKVGPRQVAPPAIGDPTEHNRAFLRRAVHYCARHGIRQILAVGCGMPWHTGLHDVARTVHPACVVVYVDHQAPFAPTKHLGENDRVAVVNIDLAGLPTVLEHSDVLSMLDVTEPMAVVLGSVHLLADNDAPAAILAAYRDAIAPGSYLALFHLTVDHDPEHAAHLVEASRNTSYPLYPRTAAEVSAFLVGCGQLVPPGVVLSPRWCPDESDESDVPAAWSYWAAVGCRD